MSENTTVTADDFETDFDASLQKLADEHIAHIASLCLSPEDLKAYYLQTASQRLGRLLEIKAPDVIVDLAIQTLLKRLEARKADRADAPAPSVKWMITSDDDGHRYVIPADREGEFLRWAAYDDSGIEPEWAHRHEGGYFTFEAPMYNGNALKVPGEGRAGS